MLASNRELVAFWPPLPNEVVGDADLVLTVSPHVHIGYNMAEISAAATAAARVALRTELAAIDGFKAEMDQRMTEFDGFKAEMDRKMTEFKAEMDK